MSHPTYSEMVLEAVTNLKSRTGSSRQAISKYLSDNFNLPDRYEMHMKLALKRLVDQNVLSQTSGTGASGSFTLNKSKSKATEGRSTKKAVEDGVEHTKSLKARPDDVKEPTTRARAVTKKKSVAEEVVHLKSDNEGRDEIDDAVKPRRKKGGETSAGEKAQSNEEGEGKIDAKPKRGRRGETKGATKGGEVAGEHPLSGEDEGATGGDEGATGGNEGATGGEEVVHQKTRSKGKGGMGTAKGSVPAMDTGEETLSDEERGKGEITTRRGKGKATKKPILSNEKVVGKSAKKPVDAIENSDEEAEGAVKPKRGKATKELVGDEKVEGEAVKPKRAKATGVKKPADIGEDTPSDGGERAAVKPKRGGIQVAVAEDTAEDTLSGEEDTDETAKNKGDALNAGESELASIKGRRLLALLVCHHHHIDMDGLIR